MDLFSALFLAILAAVPTILTTQLNTAVPFAASSILIAVSVSLETIRAIALTGPRRPDFISVGRLTHSAVAADFSMTLIPA